jgi:hypothetical protein
MARYAKFFSVGGGGGGTNNLQLPVGTILDTTLRQVQDGLGTGSPLYLSTRRVGITSDASVTTQTSSVIQATTTNANLVIAPNGTGALIAQIPDGTIVGGNARGTNAVDLQTVRAASNQVASGTYSFIGGGQRNRNTGFASTILGGEGNTVTGNYISINGGQSNSASAEGSVLNGGQSNTVSSQYGVVSGGQSNTASTATHATVVGGQSNTSSGYASVAGGVSNTASGQRSVALGSSNISNSFATISLGDSNTSSGNSSIALGASNTSSQFASLATGDSALSYINRGHSHGNGRFSALGDAQFSNCISRNSAALTTGATMVLYVDGGSALLIPNGTNRAWNVQVNWVAVVTAITGTATGVTVGDIITGESLFGFKRIGGVSSIRSFIRDSQAADTAIMDTCSLAYSAGASQELAMTFTGPTFAGGGSVTMRIVAKVELVEVAY